MNSAIIEQMVLNHVIAIRDPFFLAKNGIDETFFEYHRDAYLMIRDHYKNYGEMPSIESVIASCPDFDYMDVTESEDTLIRKLRSIRLKREQKTMLESLAQRFRDIDGFQAVKELRREVDRLERLGGIDQGVGVNLSVAGDIRRQLYEESKRGDIYRVPTPFSKLNEVLGGGMESGDYVLLMAFTNRGKSWLGALFGLTANMSGYRVSHISLEMSAKRNIFRIDTLDGKFPNRDLIMGKLTDEEAYMRYCEQFDPENASRPDYWLYTAKDFRQFGGCTLEAIEWVIKKDNPQLLIIDQFSHLKGRGRKREHLNELSEEIQTLAQAYGICVLLLHQTPGESEKKKGEDDNGMRPLKPPKLTDYAETIQVVRDARTVLGFDSVPGKAQISLLKATDAPEVGVTIDLQWQPNFGIIREFEPVDLF